jgi:SAM-dependent methyltransferase
MLRQLTVTAARLGLEIETVRADAEELPFDDDTFDLVLGHAVLHHLPAVESAFAEFWRVLAPGGTLAFMGEPSRHGDLLASLPKRVGELARPAWRRLIAPTAWNGDSGRADGRALDTEPALEPLVDVHVFSPAALQRLAGEAGFAQVRVSGEELLASAYGWLLRSLQAGSDPDRVPRLWHQLAFRSYLALQWVDGTLLEPRLPPSLFYNLLLSARKP